MGKRFLVTAGLPYSNGRLHVGHIGGAYLPADIFVRYQRATGADVRFICGSDDNGVAIEISAMQAGVSPQEICTRYHEGQKRDFAGLRIDFDVYGGTHQPHYRETHERFSQAFFTTIYDKGYFTKRTTRQLFDAKANRFLPDRYVKGTCHHCGTPGANGDQCEACGKMIDPLLLKDPISTISGEPAEARETTHWHLKLADFEKPLRDWLESKQDQWRSSVLNFALGQIKQGLPERAMTRDISWGVPVPLDDPEAKGKVLFVWFDAPIGYISFTAQLCHDQGGDAAGYEKWWRDPETKIIHFIGEDNTVFHALIWPAMLMAEGQHQLPDNVVANNFINFRIDGEEAKVSKSKTAAESPVWIEEFLKRYSPDALRYYLTAIAPETSRTAFDFNDFVARNNNELVATFGNFVNRTLQFVAKYLDGNIPEGGGANDADRAHLAAGDAALKRVGELIETHRYRAALEEMMGYARACNQHFGAREPWRLRKEDLADCNAAIATCVRAVQYLAVLCAPFMPSAAERIAQCLGTADAATALKWAAPEPLPAGHALREPQILFERLDA
ncbi:MAG: methionine--tRNA ligase [Phycisphaerales bacterium]|nr:methionine--tRNA ligase [Phycisphaerales bacterium]